MARPIPVRDQPRDSSAEILSAQVSMAPRLWHPIAICQRHPIRLFRNDPGMTIGTRIRQARKAQDNMSRTELARRTNIPYPTLAGIENGDQGSSTRLHAIAEALGVTVSWLETGKGPRSESVASAESGWADITGYAQSVGLGKGAEAQEYAETHKLKFRADSLQRKRLNPSKLHVMYGDGDSMQPRVAQGDAILFDESDKSPRDGKLFVIEWNGEIYVKRCEVIDDIVYFRADNPAGDHHWKKPKRVDSARDPINIIGRVRWIGSWED